ncbi:hypothetical protein Tco_0153563 [Tanacetum coccineum]
MNPQKTEQVIARDELWVPTAERVNISTINVRLETTVKKKEETFQVVIVVIKNSTCIKAFTISADRQKCVIDAEGLWKILDICLRTEGEDFYCNQHASALEELWQLASTSVYLERPASNDKLRKSRIDYYEGAPPPCFNRENVGLTIFDFGKTLLTKNDHRRRKSQDVKKCISLIYKVQQYGLAILATMLNNKIIQSESYKRFILYSTGQIPPKKSRGKEGKSSIKSCKKKATISFDDNIVPEPYIAFVIRISISLNMKLKKKQQQDKFIPLMQRIFLRTFSNLENKGSVKYWLFPKQPQKAQGHSILTPAEQEAALTK